MGVRPADWSVVGYGSDPVPGDPVVVRQGGVNYRQVADRISSVVATLRGLSDDQSDARSVDVVIEQKDAVADSIERAEQRYRTAGDALVEYAQVLDSAQASSAHALGQAQAARRDADLQRQTAEKWGREAKQATDADEKARYKRFQRQAEGNAADHEAMVGVWETRCRSGLA
jgi:thioredoxin-like negative regulator of GroEL